MTATLNALIEQTALQAVHPSIAALAEKIRIDHKHVVAVLAYGSAFRDASPTDTLIDFYLLTEDLRGVASSALSRFGCRLVPPNIYYAERDVAGTTVRAKYAVLPLPAFQQRVSRQTGNPYFWARFAQPCRIVWRRDSEIQDLVISALGASVTTAYAHAKGIDADGTTKAMWTKLFVCTYQTELRPESKDRAAHIFEANPVYFETASKLLAATPPVHANWAWRRFQGKFLSVARLFKAAFTFQGGADYIAWKIKRHSGVTIAVKNWHRRHPLLAAIVLMPQLLWRGAVK